MDNRSRLNGDCRDIYLGWHYLAWDYGLLVCVDVRCCVWRHVGVLVCVSVGIGIWVRVRNSIRVCVRVGLRIWLRIGLGIGLRVWVWNWVYYLVVLVLIIPVIMIVMVVSLSVCFGHRFEVAQYLQAPDCTHLGDVEAHAPESVNFAVLDHNYFESEDLNDHGSG